MKKLIVLNLFLLAVLFLVACTNDPSTDENKEDILIETSSAVETDEVEVDEQEHKEESPEESNGTFIQATVVRVVDGDTVIVKLPNNTEERVRLLLIDTPESVHPTKPVQPFGLEASEFAKELMYPGKTVELELDIIERDRYGRLLAYVWIGDEMLNELLLENGLARVAYIFAPNTRHVDRFYEIQKKAQQQAIGIWSIENYATEGGFAEEVDLEKQEPSKLANACDDPKIKGNHSSSGDLIYHIPGGQYYEKTNPEEMFCTEEEAKEAGYRKSMR